MTDAAAPTDGDEVVVGRVVKPHGLRGEVVVLPSSDRDDRFAPGATLTGTDKTVYEVASSRGHQGRVLVRFAGVEDRTAAEGLRGLGLSAAATDDAPTYFAHELVGARVVGPDEVEVGTVVDVVELPAAAGYDLLEVDAHGGGLLLLPAADELMAVASDDDGRLTLALVDPPEGLLDPQGG